MNAVSKKKTSATEEKPAPKVETVKRRRNGKAYGKPKPDHKTGQTKLACKTIMGIRRDRFLSEILPQFNGLTRSQIFAMDPFDLNREIESVVTLIRTRKAERRGHGKDGRYQNFRNGPGRPRSARDAELRRPAQRDEPKHTRLLDEAVVAATAIGKMRGTKSDEEVRIIVNKMRGEIVGATQRNVIAEAGEDPYAFALPGDYISDSEF